MSFTIEFALGGNSVKRITFPGKAGRRDITTSNGTKVGTLTLSATGLRVELDEDTANLIAYGDFH